MIIPLTKQQESIIIGNILGDGGIYDYKSLRGKSGIYYIKQSQKYKNYIFWLFDQLKNICPSFPKQRKDNQQWYFYSRYLENLADFRKAFYKNKKKVIPGNIEKWFFCHFVRAFQCYRYIGIRGRDDYGAEIL